MKAHKGIFITFEGPEGSGKSTQAKKTASYLRSKGYRVRLTREPGGTKLAEEIRQLLLHTESRVSGLAELLLYEASRAQHIKEVIVPCLRSGFIVICDRFTDSTLAYQGFGRGIPIPIVQQLNRIASQGVVPARTILLDVPVKKGLVRARAVSGGGRGDRIEHESMVFHNKVKRGFLALARRFPRRFRRVVQRKNINETFALIKQHIDAII